MAGKVKSTGNRRIKNPAAEKKSQKNLVKWSKSYWLQAPLIVVLAIVPLLMYYYEFNTHLGSYSWFGSDMRRDLYLYAKMVALIIVSGCMVIVMLFQHFLMDHHIVWDKKFIPLAVYAGLVIVSTFFSISKYHSFHGIYTQFEPVWVLLGYCVITVYAFYLIRTEEAVHRLMACFAVGIAFMAVIGISQILGHNILRTDIWKTLITPSRFDIHKYDFSTEKGRTILTLYNPDYVGGYTALVIPVMAGMAIGSKRLWKRIIYGILAVLMLGILFASQSRGGMIALAFAIIVELVFMRETIIRHWKYSITFLGVAVIAFVGINAFSNNQLLEKFSKILKSGETGYNLQFIQTNDDNVVIGFNDNELSFSVVKNAQGEDEFSLYDQNNQRLTCTLGKNNVDWYVDDERFPIIFTSWNRDGFQGYRFYIEGRTWDITNSMKEGDSSYYLYWKNKLVKLHRKQTYKGYFAEHVHLASGRGFIWSRTIPLLKKYGLLGSGPDTFAIVFPNDDIVGREMIGYANSITTKPHNWYLQIAVQTGIPSLVAMLVFIFWYIYDSACVYWKKEKREFLYWIGLSCMISTIGFLVAGIVNDSLIGVTPIFFTLLGVGLSVNQMIKRQFQ